MKNHKLTQFKQWILSIVRRSYSFEEMERAYEGLGLITPNG